MASICLLSSIHPWVNPRAIKEADALHAAGHEVTLAYRAASAWADERDAELLAHRPWKRRRFSYIREEGGGRWALAAARQRAAVELVRRGVRSERADAEAYCRGFTTMCRWAARHSAELYIAHTQQMLPVAAHAAQVNGVPFAFDCEDLLADHNADGLGAPWRREMILRIERRYLPGARYVTAPSKAMAEHLRAVHGIANVHVVYNSFPTAEFGGLLPPDQRPRRESVRLVWLSATIGPGRGLEDIFTALPRLGALFELHLVGDVLPAHTAWLEAMQHRLGSQPKAVIHPAVPHERIPAVLSEYDVGLALESDGLNYRLTASNKLFHYLQSGLAVAATRTPGQAEVLTGCGDPLPGILYPAGDVGALVLALRSLGAGDTLPTAKQAAWRAGRERYNWDREQTVVLDAVARTMEGSATRSQVERTLPNASVHL